MEITDPMRSIVSKEEAGLVSYTKAVGTHINIKDHYPLYSLCQAIGKEIPKRRGCLVQDLNVSVDGVKSNQGAL